MEHLEKLNSMGVYMLKHAPKTGDKRAERKEKKYHLDRCCSYRNYQKLTEAVELLHAIGEAAQGLVDIGEIPADTEFAELIEKNLKAARSAVDRIDVPI